MLSLGLGCSSPVSRLLTCRQKCGLFKPGCSVFSTPSLPQTCRFEISLSTSVCTSPGGWPDGVAGSCRQRGGRTVPPAMVLLLSQQALPVCTASPRWASAGLSLEEGGQGWQSGDQGMVLAEQGGPEGQGLQVAGQSCSRSCGCVLRSQAVVEDGSQKWQCFSETGSLACFATAQGLCSTRYFPLNFRMPFLATSVLTIPSDGASGPDADLTARGFGSAPCALPETRCVPSGVPACMSDNSIALLCRGALRINKGKEVHSKGVGKT